MKSKILAVILLLFPASFVFAQHSVKLILKDADNNDPVSFATVSLMREGAEKPAKYVLSDEKGIVKLSEVKAGEYILKAELLGYQQFSQKLKVSSNVDLGIVKMTSDTEQLNAAKVSAAGNPIIVKKDTIEYNASSFKTTENDMLADLLVKLPGVEVSESGTITVNGQEVKKITIDGKTFFLDDPQLASNNIPARIINKLKVVEKKSEQAEFTGIDDGETETVIDLNIKKGMMNGLFGNVMGGGGHDLPTDKEVNKDWRFQGAGFLGRFASHSQISAILNGNNTNNRGFNDLAGNMMGNMRSGQMGRGQGGWGNSNGITTSWMAGVNGAFDLLDNKMELGGNYLYNDSDKYVTESSLKTSFQRDSDNLESKSNGVSDTRSYGHRFGIRLVHKFSDNTSIVFQPQVNFGGGNYYQNSKDETYRGEIADDKKLNEATINNDGYNKNVSTNGFLMLRQKLGKPGRTLTVVGRYNYSNNNLNGNNNSETNTFDGSVKPDPVHQRFDNLQDNISLTGRVNYTEPLGGNFYFEAHYMYNWNKSYSDKNTYDIITNQIVDAYTNEITNEYVNQSMGVNFLFQKPKFRLQLGFAAKPTMTHNTTSAAKGQKVDTTFNVWNFSPQGMIYWEMAENSNLRVFYNGRSRQPSVSQLIPIPDNSNPLSYSYGNPSLQPYFTHDMNGDVRYNNKKTFFSFNLRFNGQYVQTPIVSAIWYNGGTQYQMPFNGKNSGNAGLQGFFNIPIGKSHFTITDMTRANWNNSSSFVGKDIDMKIYDPNGSGELDYKTFLSDLAAGKLNFEENKTNTLSVTERLRVIYRLDNLELSASARTRVSRSWYDLAANKDNTLTWNNQARATANWTWDAPGLTFKAEFNYNWYRGYSVDMPDEYILNAEIQKTLLKKKMTLALKGYDILGQAKNLSVTDDTNYHKEVLNNTLGRYIILSLTYRFGNFDKSKMKGGPHGPGGPGGPGGYGPPMR